jgi:AAA+ ATPase superfamily predicted ATPase
MIIIGREEEQYRLQELFESSQPEFLALYGRRRVGKTYLVKEFFHNDFCFYVTGKQGASMREQLDAFASSLRAYGLMGQMSLKDWNDAFDSLRGMINNSSSEGKKVIFLDELPWLATPRSGFLSSLEYFWNSWASSRPDVMLIVCGSATSWMVEKILKNTGGLYNRLTARMHLRPFTLRECEEYLKSRNVIFNRLHLIECYMVFGGVPYYLRLLDKRYDLARNIDRLCFQEYGELTNEFDILFSSLFKHPEGYMKVVKALASKNKGMAREEIIHSAGIMNGGGLTKILSELELSGFIRSYSSFGKKNKNVLYQLIDAFSLFSLRFMQGRKINDEQYWSIFTRTSAYAAWSGFAFERVVLQHIKQVKQSLGINGVLTNVSSWRSKTSKYGAQIDLVIDRADDIINLCEIKFSHDEFTIDKAYDRNLRNKRSAFLAETKTRKAIHQTMVTTYGLKRNEYAGMIQSEVTADDLFT